MPISIFWSVAAEPRICVIRTERHACCVMLGMRQVSRVSGWVAITRIICMSCIEPGESFLPLIRTRPYDFRVKRCLQVKI